MPDEPVKAIGLEAVIGLHRDQDAEAVAQIKDSSHAHESADRGDGQPQVADSVAVDRPTVETIECGGSHANAMARIINGMKIQRLAGSSRRPIPRLLLPEKA